MYLSARSSKYILRNIRKDTFNFSHQNHYTNERIPDILRHQQKLVYSIHNVQSKYKYGKLHHLFKKVATFHTCQSELLGNGKSPSGTTKEEKKSSGNQIKVNAEESQENNPSLSATARFKEAVINAIPRKKEKVKEESKHLSKERNFLTAIRAMSEFLLSPEDLEDLRQTKRRSPFEDEPPITVYWRRDVEAKAFKVWGSLEALEKEKQKREQEIKDYQQYVFNLKRVLREYRRHQDKKFASSEENVQKSTKKPMDASGKVVWTAVVINGANFVMKLGAWAFTGSHSLFAEALHSLADFTNQIILAYGIHKSNQEANFDHPYGYTTMRYVSSLISGAMIFCVGAGLSVQHGISGLMHPTEVIPLYWAFFILGGSLITEGGTLVLAIDAIRKGAKEENMTFMNYVLRGSDPSVNVVLLEDMAAVLGVGICFVCMGMTSTTGSHVPDAMGSCIIGGLLAGVSGFIVYTNSTALVGRSIPQQDLLKINNELESDVMIRAIHDVKGIDMGSGFVRYKAEVDFDGRELTRKYLDKHDIETILREMRSLETADDVEAFLLKYGENIVEGLGGEVDRIERSLKKKHPEVRHIDLEIL